MAKDQKIYMPLMIGDWLKGTRGMKAEVRGVYINLLLYQWDNGFIPSDMEDLCLIDPELPKVWVKLKDKFLETEPGKLQNKKNEEVRAFWQKQRKNGEKGGRPTKEDNEEPKHKPNNNPKENPNNNHHIDLDIEYDIDLKLKRALDEIYLDQEKIKWPHINFDFEIETFKNKVRGSPEHYENHDSGGIKLALQSQLRKAKNKQNGNGFTDKRQDNLNDLRKDFAERVINRRENGQV
jgi:uncharacterized protein YdaU (DUF1376 family)